MTEAVNNGGFRKLLALNAVLTRALLRQTVDDPRRSIDDECGYPAEPVGVDTYQDLYDRDAIAARVVQVMPAETWQVHPTVYEDENPDVLTTFEEAWLNLGRDLYGDENWFRDEEGGPIYDYLARVDELSGVGQYGILLLGLNDGKRMSEPATPMEYSKEQSRLLYIRPFSERLATITKRETDKRNPRFGQPIEYEITLSDPREESGASGMGMVGMATEVVHWTRVIHVVDNRTSSETFGVPRMRRVLNNILNLRKLYGGSAEMYWKGAFPGYALESHPQLGTEVDMDDEATKDMMEEYMNGLQRYFRLIGMSARSLAPQVVDPSPQIERQLEAICIQLNIPKRIFMGSEKGELASGQDQKAWNKRVMGRQVGYVTPRILVPFINRLVYLGYLPQPRWTKKRKKEEVELVTNALGETVGVRIRSRGGYTIYWPDIAAQSNQERANVTLTLVQALAAYMSGNVSQIIPPKHLLTQIVGFTDAEAVEILKAAAEERAKQEEEMKKKMEDGLANQPGMEGDTASSPSNDIQGESGDKKMDEGRDQGGNPPNQPPEKRGAGNGVIARKETRV